MNLDLLKRLRRLEAKAEQRQAGKTVFVLEDGARFLTEDDPITYLLQHGTESPRGRIVGYAHTEGDIDPISRSVGEYIRELIS